MVLPRIWRIKAQIPREVTFRWVWEAWFYLLCPRLGINLALSKEPLLRWMEETELQPSSSQRTKQQLAESTAVLPPTAWVRRNHKLLSPCKARKSDDDLAWLFSKPQQNWATTWRGVRRFLWNCHLLSPVVDSG